MNITFETIGIIHSCYKEKFGIPRQSGLVSEATAKIELFKPFNHPDTIRGLDAFSHIWVTFVFDQHIGKGFNNLVSPPRLNGKEQVGVYATRSPYRPNPIGLSVVQLEQIECKDEKLFLYIKGADILDQTPILDIKPYIQYADSLDNTRNGFISQIAENDFNISFSELAKNQIETAANKIPEIRQFILQFLSQDPRPHYNKLIKKNYSSKVYQYDLHWTINENNIEVTSLGNTN